MNILTNIKHLAGNVKVALGHIRIKRRKRRPKLIGYLTTVTTKNEAEYINSGEADAVTLLATKRGLQNLRTVWGSQQYPIAADILLADNSLYSVHSRTLNGYYAIPVYDEEDLRYIQENQKIKILGFG